MKKIISILFIAATLLSACVGGSTDPAPAPEKALLVAPAQNEVCNQGDVISATQSSVTLQWKAADNAETYDVTVKNLSSGASITQNTADTQLKITLARNTPFSWAVTSKSTKSTETATSDTWKFYNSGPGITSYAPFPAELLSPTADQTVSSLTGKITLSWSGSDPDNDLARFDVYFGTTPQPTMLKSGLTTSTLDVNVSTGNTYYWKIVTTDAQNNKSTSDINKFTVK